MPSGNLDSNRKLGLFCAAPSLRQSLGLSLKQRAVFRRRRFSPSCPPQFRSRRNAECLPLLAPRTRIRNCIRGVNYEVPGPALKADFHPGLGPWFAQIAAIMKLSAHVLGVLYQKQPKPCKRKFGNSYTLLNRLTIIKLYYHQTFNRSIGKIFKLAPPLTTAFVEISTGLH